MTPDKMGCMPICAFNEELAKDGRTCLIKCGAKMQRSDDGKSCIMICEDGYMNTPDGRGCMEIIQKERVKCKRGFVPTKGGCQKIECGPGSMLNRLGEGCISKEEWYKMNGWGWYNE